MRTSAAGSKRPPLCCTAAGFTLLEMLVALTIVAITSAGVMWSLRDIDEERLDRQAQQLQAQLEVARGIARATATAVRLRLLPDGYVFDGLAADDTGLAGHHPWIDAQLSALAPAPVLLGPEPIGPPLRIELSLGPARRILSSDGWSPVAIE
ncbi:MAG: prepilin-type N-terminal cleavage/methylation domain-containing protein [Tepidimonas sp.]|uniref:prepilin-type N-terminal cleavage/methylation domain-containing protein n=1 Tax=Tepidimonas sp. TaxID=2002775 RepID=UPI004054ED15